MQNIKNQFQRSLKDWLLWFLAFAIITLAISTNYYFAQLASSLKVASILLTTISVLAIFSFTKEGKSFWHFAKEARNELRRVVWPNKQETVQTTLIIIVVVVIVALFLWAIDSVLFWLMTFITGQRG